MKHAFYIETEEIFKTDSGICVWVGREAVTEGEVKQAPSMLEINIDNESGGEIATIHVDLELVPNSSNDAIDTFCIQMFTMRGMEKTILCTSDQLPIRQLTRVCGNSRYTEYTAMIIEEEIRWMFANLLLPIVIKDKMGVIRILDTDGNGNDNAFQNADMKPDIIHTLVHRYGAETDDIPETTKRRRA